MWVHGGAASTSGPVCCSTGDLQSDHPSRLVFYRGDDDYSPRIPMWYSNSAGWRQVSPKFRAFRLALGLPCAAQQEPRSRTRSVLQGRQTFRESQVQSDVFPIMQHVLWHMDISDGR
jgi:hypothetical protein